MLREIFFGGTKNQAIRKSLDAGMMRSKIISNNIANLSTPNFKRSEVSFEKQLRAALNQTGVKGVRTSGKHIPLGRKAVAEVKPQFYQPVDHTLPSGINNVEIETEMAKLVENQLLYQFAAKRQKGTALKLLSAIKSRSLPTE